MTSLTRPFRTACLAICLVVALVAAAGHPAVSSEGDSRRKPSKRAIKVDLEFAAKMAAQGLWKEALFRWEKVLKARPDDGRLLNNIAVAREAIGDVDGAREAYRRALELDPDDSIIANQTLFIRSLERLATDDDLEPVDGTDGSPAKAEARGGAS